MDEKICLDTDFIINLINDKDRSEIFFSDYDSLEVYTTTINIFELFLRATNLEEVYNLLNRIGIFDLNKDAAILASEIYKNLKSSGNLIEFRDIFIAAISIVNGCTLATLNKKHFSRIKGLKLLNFQ